MSENQLRGVLPVFQTPFHSDESIDFETLGREIAWLFDQGADGIVMAMVSETLRLSTEERRQVADTACRSAQGRGTSVISVGAESTKVAEDLARHAESVGATAVMAIPPISVALSDAELRTYYARLIRALKIPVIIQDASGYVGRPMHIAFQAELMHEFGPNRVFYKPEAPPLVERFAELRNVTDGQAAIFEGSGGAALLETFPLGAAGTMPGADLLIAIVPLWRALQCGDHQRAASIHAALTKLLSFQQSLDAYLAVEKHLLMRQGIFSNDVVRGPVAFHLTTEKRRAVDAAFDDLLAAL